jgi:two-component system response regulator AtoC
MMAGAPARTLGSAAAGQRQPSIAIVDDDSGFTGYLRTFLTQRGHEARVYTRGDAIVAAIRHGEPPDIVLLDVAMPGMDGLETLKALKAGRPAVQVIMLSSRDQASVIVEAVRHGAVDYVVKPADPEGLGELALDAAITQAIERSRLVAELADLRGRSGDEHDDAVLAWRRSPAMRDVAHLIDQVADSDVTVLIRGESGVGKELVARAIHRRSPRKPKPFVKVNCAALPAELLESELFGHEKGAFTGAGATRIGRFEQAHLGTMFLDEIAEMKPALQAKILHVLQDGEFTRLGSNGKIRADVRVVTATNRNLETMILRGQFREDLYYRLKVIEAVVPPLRDRRDEIPQLTDVFIEKYSRHYKRPAPPLSEALRGRFAQYDWPGNIRELENMIKRFVILQDERRLLEELAVSPPLQPPPAAEADDASGDADATPAPGPDPPVRRLADVSREAALRAERRVIADTLVHVHWNRREAARRLQVSYKTLLNKIKQTGLERPQ